MVKTILILAANPKDTSRLRLDREVREIDAGLQRALKRDDFILNQVWAVRPSDFRRAMLDFKPNITHFCGHGSGEEGIAFEDELGNTNLVNSETLGSFFELFSTSVECVVLNACYSESQASAIAQHIPYVVGMNGAIKDTTAIEFAVAFYDALGAGEDINFAFKVATNAINWADKDESIKPILEVKPVQLHDPIHEDLPVRYDMSFGSEPEAGDLNSALRFLDKLVGLAEAKEFIHQQVNRIQLEKRRNKHVGQFPPDLIPMVFTGNPGTGKTTIARLLGQILMRLGYLETGHLLCVTRADLVAGYVGQTAIRTRLTVERAMGGVFFLDEAHSLDSTHIAGFEHEALDELLSLMAMHRHEILFILSGDSDGMSALFEGHPGLGGRLPSHIHFPDYSLEELLAMLREMASQRGFVLLPETMEKAESYFQNAIEERGSSFGNAYEATRLLERMSASCAERLFRENIEVQSRPVILPEDVPI